MEQILINERKHKCADLQRQVETTVRRCQDLIDAFHAFQDWKQIETIEDFIQLISDPAKYFDEVLLSNVDLKSTGNRRPDPGHVAKIFDIDRNSWLNLVAGVTIKTDCEPCKKIKIRKGQTAISLSEFSSSSKYLFFDSGKFYLNQEAIDATKETFKVYAISPEQIRIVKHYRDLVTVINDHFKLGLCGWDALEKTAKSLNLLYAEGLVEPNDEDLTNLILRMQL